MDLQNRKNPLIKLKCGTNKSLAFVAVIAIILASLLITGFVYEERRRQIEETGYRLIDTAARDAVIVYDLFDGYINTLRAMAVYLKSYDDLTSAETIGFLRKMADGFEFERLSMSFPDGKSYTTDGTELDITQTDFLESVKSGQVFITNVANSIIDGAPVVCIQVPINRDGILIASLGLSLKRDYLNNILKPILSADINYFDSLDAFTYGKGSSKELIEKAFTDDKEGLLEFSLEGFDRYGYYKPVGINNWVMLTVTSKNVVEANTNRFLTNALTLAAQILFLFLVVAFFVYRDQKKVRETTELDEQCFRILAAHMGKAVLEWNYNKKRMDFPNFEKAFGQKPLKDSLSSADEAINVGAVHPDDYDLYREMFSDTINGRVVENLRLRMRAADESFKYYSISSVVVHDAKGRPYKSIGFLENIDSQIRKEKFLRQKANTDQLTGFYNKAATETFISEALSTSNDEAEHALLSIDLDNFKSINDGFGHLFGDEVLKELAASIKLLFRASDILGRFGGDEFVVFIRDIPSIEFIKEKAAELNECMSKTYRQDNVACTISASIAIFPTDGTTYETLYNKADEASYTLKNAGKNLYSFAVAAGENSKPITRDEVLERGSA